MNVDRLFEWPFKDVIQTYTFRDTILYALSVGFGADPDDKDQLRYVFEKDLVTVPSMVLVMGRPDPWMLDPAAGIDFKKIVFGEQSLEIYRPFPPAGTIRARERISGVIDKGKDKGAVVYVDRSIVDHGTGDPLATVKGTLFCRGDGGFGTSRGDVVRKIHEIPETKPERVVEIATLPQSALLYRLNGDFNPLHADPEHARSVGFPKPILHGLCTYGFAVQALLKMWCDYDNTRLKSVTARFSAPVYPGETLIIESWRSTEDAGISFRSWVKERKVKVLDNGYADIASS